MDSRNYTKEMRELATLKPHDLPQSEREIGRGYKKIYTGGHGYLFVGRDDMYASVARSVDTGYGFVGELGYYLEEDCEMPAFIAEVKSLESRTFMHITR